MPGSQHLNDSDKELGLRGDADWNSGSRDYNVDRSFDIALTKSLRAVPPTCQGQPSTYQGLSPRPVTHEVLEDDGKDGIIQSNRDEYASLSPWNAASRADGDDQLAVDLIEDQRKISCFPGDEQARSGEAMPSMTLKSFEEDTTQVQSQTDPGVLSAHSPIGIHGAISGDSPNIAPMASQGGTWFNEPQSPGRIIEGLISIAPSVSLNVSALDVLEHAETPQLESNPTSDSIDRSSKVGAPEVFGDTRSQGSGSAPKASTTHNKAEVADLAALWEAALEDDELLEDDEQGLDPSPLFVNDGKDFFRTHPIEIVTSYPSAEPISTPLDRTDDPLLESSHVDIRNKTHNLVSRVECAPVSDQRQLALSPEHGAYQDVIEAYAPLPDMPTLRTQISPATADSAGPSGQQQHSLYEQIPPRAQVSNIAQSFSDKSKGGYTSPYDLPVELTRPKKRTHLQQMQTASDPRGFDHVFHPPRSSSIHPEAVSPLGSASAEILLSADHDMRTVSATIATQPVKVKPKTENFFEQLPPQKPRSSGIRATNFTLAPHPTQSVGPQLRRELPLDTSFTQSAVPSSPGPPKPYQLLPPERLDLYAHAPHQEFLGQSLASRTRYSPAPTRPASTNHLGMNRHALDQESSSPSPAPASRYSPAPGRPASVNLQGPLPHVESPNSRVPQRAIPQVTSFPQRFEFVRPSDGREKDPLERWKGCPIFTFGFGGTSVSSFPKQIPRYPAGQTFPMMKCSPGEVKLNVGMVVALDEFVSSFPGPLKFKSKKKEILDWMQERISQLADSAIIVVNDSVNSNLRKRHEEKIILWEIIAILVGHDGVIEGNPGAISAVRCVLSPEVASTIIIPHNISSHGPHRYLDGIIKSDRSHKVSNSPNPESTEAVEALRKILLQGEQEKAVWYAADQRLWAHALLLASTLHPEIWRHVIQEFIRQEVRTFGQNTESLASFYQVLAGNWEESIDELVLPSARAGLPMVSGVERPSLSINALDGLDRWRETLTLILSNRSQDDWKALLSLGQLLWSYGRIEAAHICFIFAKSPGLFGGGDDVQDSVALIGADHITHPLDYCRDLDSILLTEIYDFATTVLTPSMAKTFSPHLQSYKLYHALMLAEYGFRAEAQQYCDTIMSALKSTTKISPFLHGLLYGALEDLAERLRQAPSDESASWISRPSMDKVSGSVWTRLNQFIAGDDSDTGSAASGKTIEPDLSGPFAHVVGDSPSISRKASMSDILNVYPAVETLSTTKLLSNSRYAPAKQATPRPPPDHVQTWSTQEPQREVVEGHKASMPQQQHHSGDPSLKGMSQESSLSFYMPLPEHREYQVQRPGSSWKSEDSAPELIPQPISDRDSTMNKAEPRLNDDDLQTSYQPDTETYSPPKSIQAPPILNHISASYHETGATDTFQPQVFNRYLSPSFTPDHGNGEEIQDDEDRLRANDDDEQSVSVTKLRPEMEKKRADVDEAFRKAAEADGTFIPRYLAFSRPDKFPLT